MENNKSKFFYKFVGAFVLFFALFGPKIDGWIDFSIIVPGIFFILFLVSNKDFRIDKASNSCLAIIFLIFIYAILITLLKESNDFYMILRNLRGLFSSFFLIFIFYKLTSSGLIDIKEFIWIVLWVMFILAVVVIVQILWPNTQVFFKDIYGFNKGIRYYRAFGLTAGYDTAGYLLVFVSIFAMIVHILSKSWMAFCISIISSIAILFTSRSSMFLFLCIFLLSLYFIIFRFKIKSYKLIPYLIVISCFFVFYIVNIFIGSIAYFNSYDPFINYSFQVQSQFAHLDDSSGYLGMYFLPENFFDLFIGTGHNTNYSDVGYIQIIFMGGLFLLALIVFFYLYLYFAAKKSIYKIRKIKKTYSWELVVLDYMVFILLVIMLLSNFKNLYFLTRGYHELIVIISVSTFGFLTQTDKSNLGV